MNPLNPSPIIQGQHIRKAYGHKPILNDLSIHIEPGKIIGLIGPNGAGKTTLLKAILGLSQFKGHLSVFGLDPRKQRDLLMQKVSFIADVATLPRWMRVQEAINFIAGTHPKFNREKCTQFIANTKLSPHMRVREMSKGMIVQLHLALIMAIDSQLLVLDEPTLGLDILYRKEFYQRLLEDYFDEGKTIIITTHQVEEIEYILTDALFIRDGRIVLDSPMEQIAERYTEVLVSAEQLEHGRRLHPIEERALPFGKTVLLFDGVANEQLKTLGETRTPGLSDLFVAIMRGAYA